MVCYRLHVSTVVPAVPGGRRFRVTCLRGLYKLYGYFPVQDTENVVQSEVKKFSMDERNTDAEPLQGQQQVRAKFRNLAAYWLLGLCNNYGYVVMLSAAHDILKKFDTDDTGTEAPSNGTVSGGNKSRDCNEISTAAILLADILPALFVKLIAPFLPFFVQIRVCLTVALSIASFLLVALSGVKWATFLGVIATSFASGLGELTLLGYTSSFNWNPITAWSSGTGAAGVLGAGSYAGLTALGITPNDSLLLMLTVPLIMALSFWVLLDRPSRLMETTTGIEGFQSSPSIQAASEDETEESGATAEATAVADATQDNLSLKTKMKYIPSLLKYMIPLGTVYLFEYFINQGLFELIYFPDISMSHSEQYRWMQLCYQIGVFISRTSASVTIIRQIWLMSVLQFLNVILFTFEAVYWFVPSVWIIFALVVWEGLLGGAAYVNTFHRISAEVPAEKEKFSLSITSLADSIGIGLAGAVSLPVHNAICLLPL